MKVTLAFVAAAAAMAPPKISLDLEGMGAYKLKKPVYRKHDLRKNVKSRQDWAQTCPAGSSSAKNCPFPVASAYDHQDNVVQVKTRVFMIDQENKPVMKQIKVGNKFFSTYGQKRSTYLLKYDACDQAGNHAEQVVFALILNDRTAPKISMCGKKAVVVEAASNWKLCSGSVAVDNVDGAITGAIKYTVKKVNAGGSSVLCAKCHYSSARKTLSTRKLGEYLVQLDVSDKAGIYGRSAKNNKARSQFKAVLVKDSIGPKCNMLGKKPFYRTVECATKYVDNSARCVDKQDGKRTVKAVSTVDTSKVGKYSVVYSATDKSKNPSTPKNLNRVVNVVDTTSPTCSIRGLSHIVHYSQDKFRDPGLKRTDTCDKSKLRVFKKWNKAFNERKIGDYVRTYSVNDASGNKCTAQRVYSVVDNKIPKLTPKGKDIITFEASNTKLYSDAGAKCIDHVDGDITNQIETVGASVSLKRPGTYKVKYDCQDLSGNQAPQQVRTVVVQDTIKPVLTLTGAKLIKREAGFTYNDKGATALDNLNGRITKKCVAKGQRMCIRTVGKVNTSKPGKYTLSYHVMDKSGNKADVIKRVIQVVDTLPPVITLKLKGKKIHKSAGNQRGQNGQRNPAGWK
jgi:hypothetical protein